MSDSTFSDEQKMAIAAWVEQGASLSEIQKRISAEFGKSLTYLEVRFLVDDLNLALKDKTPPAPSPAAAPAAARGVPAPADGEVLSVGDAAGYGSAAYGANYAAGNPNYAGNSVSDDDDVYDAETGRPAGAPGDDNNGDSAAGDDLLGSAGTGKVSVTIDPVQEPGIAAGGSVTFSDGQTGKWFLDGYGRLGFEPAITGYRPTPADVQQFQIVLQRELQKQGF